MNQTAVADRSEPSQTRTSDLREERKYPLSAAQALAVRGILEGALPRDPDYPDGTITTCYYDTPDLSAYWESADGAWGKAKLRLRWYGDPVDPSAGAWLERKRRAGLQSGKTRVRVSPTGLDLGEGLRLPTRSELADMLRALDVTPSSTLEPTAVLRYERRRWRDRTSDLRVSLDTVMRAAWPQPRLSWIAVPQGGVLELKSTDPLPSRLRALSRFGLRRSAHAKYAIAVEALRGTRDPRTR